MHILEFLKQYLKNKKGSVSGKILGAILAVIFSFYVIIYALVPQLSDWAIAISTINGVDYGWTVYLAFLVMVLAVVFMVVKKTGLGKV